ncbi:unconventional myosin-XVIIIb isoform X2 [Eublepharis macularius]|uniref:Unconventional myosin-XVIIIb isoform X2 n=1 Tax=Eublepharis macularius TaxID=481883 RepID=A0AA97K630_EUBMA|nr:unconventional myosin-XVIIIb isoform X2 [Eublepharis macularius]
MIREEDRSPPPTSPPPLFSVIPGGFIKQLVRETEKESKEAKLKDRITLNTKEDPPGKQIDGTVQQFVIKDADIMQVGKDVAGKGELLQDRLNGEKPNGGGVAEIPERKPSPFKRCSAKQPVPPAAQSVPAAPKSGEQTPPNASQAPKVPAAVQNKNGISGDAKAGTGPSQNTTEMVKKCPPLGSKHLESPKRDTGIQKPKEEPQSRPGSKEKAARKGKELGDPRERPGEAGGKPAGAKVKLGMYGKRSGERREDPAAAVKGSTEAEKQGGSGKGPEEIQEKPTGAGEKGKQESAVGETTGELEMEVRLAEAQEATGRELGDGATCEQAQEKDVWYEAEKVWLGQKGGFTLATELKPDVGTPELPQGRVRVRVEADGSVTEVDEENIQRTNPSRFDHAEDLASLISLNEASTLNTLQCRYQSQLLYTYAGADLVAIQPCSSVASYSKKAFRGRRDGMPPHIFSVAQRAYWSLLMQRQDQTIMPLGRSGAGKTTCCQHALEYLAATAGSVDNRVTVEKIQAMFTVLRAFGTVSSSHSPAATRFSMVMALDFGATGRITAAHLQTMLLERVRVVQRPEGEGNFSVFAQMLAGLDLDQRTTLHLHHVVESNSFGIQPCLKGEEKQKAAAAFSQLQAAMETLGIMAEEQKAVWRVLAGIYHLGVAGACKVGRKQFMRFEWANNAAEVLGCEFEELTTSVFKHHLKRIIEQVTSGSRGPLGQDEDQPEGPKMTGVECVEGMAVGLYEELFAALVSLINRSFSSNHLSMASVMVVDTPGFCNPRHQREERAATFEELCRNYTQDRLQMLFYERTFASALRRYQQENIEVAFELPDLSPATTVAIVDKNSSKVHISAGGAEDPKGLFWILDEEALLHGSSDSGALDRLCSHFTEEGTPEEEPGSLRKCEQPLQFEISHQLGQDPVRYDASGWVAKAKWNLSAQNAIQILQQSKIDALKKLFLQRSKVPLVCRSVAGLDGSSQQTLQRVGCVRKTFTSSFAAVKKRSVCAQIKLQLDALANLVKRSQIHFVHCLIPRTDADRIKEKTPQPSGMPGAAGWDVPALRVQLSGAQILDALRLYRAGYADCMALTQFRRRFQILAQPVMKKYTSAYEATDEDKALEELFQALDLEKKSFAVGHTQVFLKAGLLSRLERQRDKLVSPSLTLLQAACKGFLSRQQFKRLKIQGLATRCIQKNLAAYQVVKAWPWWKLMCCVRPLLSASLEEGQLRAKEEELEALRKKLQASDLSRQELQQNTEVLETKIVDLTTELSDERLKGDVACQVLEGEQAERLRGAREIKELQSKYDQLQRKLESAEKQLEEMQQELQLRDLEARSSGEEGEWQMRLDCAQTEIGFLRKRISQLGERVESEQNSKQELEQKLSEAQKAYEGAKRGAQQLKRKCKQLTCDLEDTRVLTESQQSRNHELEKKQKKFDMQLAQALGESAFEKSLREKVALENTSLQYELARLQRSLEEKESENASLSQRITVLGSRVQELSSPSSLDPTAVAALRKKLWDLEASASEQQQALSCQARTIEQLEQLHLRLELEIERTKQLHQKELEDKEEELEDVRQSCQKRLRQLEMQCEQEQDEKQAILREKQDLEGLIATLCEQIGHRDFDVEKRLRRDLKRTHALLADVQLLLATAGGDTGPLGSREELEKLRSQWEESEARRAAAQESHEALARELESRHAELEAVARNKNLVDEQLYQLQHERADLLKRIEEDQEDLNELMDKHKTLIAQSATDIAQIQELQAQLDEVKTQKHSLHEKLQAAQTRLAYLEQSMVERSIVSRQEAVICDLENKMEFQRVQIKRFEMLVLRLRDSVIKVGEEVEKAKEAEVREKENARYYQLRMEEMKADLTELAQRELEANRRRVELEKQVGELSAVRQTLQADLETSIRRIADLQAALEEVQSSDESDTESVQTARESLSSKQETESQLSLGSTWSINLEPEGSVQSWSGSASGWSSASGASLAGSLLRQPADSRSAQSLRINKDRARSPPALSSLSVKRWEYGKNAGEEGLGKATSPSIGAQRWEYGKLVSREESDMPKKLGSGSPPVMRKRLSPAASAEEKLPSPVSPSVIRRMSPSTDGKLLRSSSALSEYVEELRRQRLKDKEPGALASDEASSLPIYQTTGASSLRRYRTLKDDDDDFPVKPDQLGEPAAAGLIRSSSLRSISSEGLTRTTPSPVLKRPSRFGSYDSLVQNRGDVHAEVGSPAPGGETFSPSRYKPWRSCLAASLEGTMATAPATDPLVFQSKRFGDAPSEAKESNPFSWEIPTLSYERKTNVEYDDILPAIRKTQSTSSLSRGPKGRKEGHRPMSVHFEDQVSADRTSFSESPLSPSLRPKEDPGDLSDSSSSSGSVVSFKSADSIKSRPGVQRLEGEGCVEKANSTSTRDGGRSEADGKDDDVNSIMMKYLGKE